MAFRIPSTRVELLRVLSAKADVSQTKAAAVWDALLALARDGVRRNGSFSFPGLGKLERVQRKPRRAYNLATGRRVRLPGKEDLVFRVSKIAKDAVLAAPVASPAPKGVAAGPVPRKSPENRRRPGSRGKPR